MERRLVVEKPLVKMQHENDCEVAALATATGKTWEEARGAVGWRDLPGGVENPVFGTPTNVSRAAGVLGFKGDECGLSALLEYRATPGATLVLVQALDTPYMAQHWVVWMGGADGWHALAWGDGGVRWKTAADLTDLVTGGWPNSVMELRAVDKLPWYKWLWWYVRHGIRW